MTGDDELWALLGGFLIRRDYDRAVDSFRRIIAYERTKAYELGVRDALEGRWGRT